MEKQYTLDLFQVGSGSTEKLIMMPYRQEDIEGHDHHFFELVYVTGGTAVHTLNDASGTLTAGDYFLIDYGSIHRYTKSRDFTLLNCLFLPDIIDDTMSGCRSFDALMQRCLIRYYTPALHQTTANRIFHDEDGRVLALLSGMQKEYQEKKAGYPEILRCRLIEILILTLRSVVRPARPLSKNSAVLGVITYVDAHYQEALTLGRFCDEHHFSLQYISRRFKQDTGMTFRDYLQKVRIEKSCELLAGSDMRVSEIAQSVGYGDLKFFNRLFKKLLNLSPREYRRLSQQNGTSSDP